MSAPTAPLTVRPTDVVEYKGARYYVDAAPTSTSPLSVIVPVDGGSPRKAMLTGANATIVPASDAAAPAVPAVKPPARATRRPAAAPAVKPAAPAPAPAAAAPRTRKPAAAKPAAPAKAAAAVKPAAAPAAAPAPAPASNPQTAALIKAGLPVGTIVRFTGGHYRFAHMMISGTDDKGRYTMIGTDALHRGSTAVAKLTPSNTIVVSVPGGTAPAKRQPRMIAPEGHVSIPTLVREINARGLYTGGSEAGLRTGSIYQYIKSAPAGYEFPSVVIDGAVVVDLEAGLDWWEAKNERAAARKRTDVVDVVDVPAAPAARKATRKPAAAAAPSASGRRSRKATSAA